MRNTQIFVIAIVAILLLGCVAVPAGKNESGANASAGGQGQAGTQPPEPGIGNGGPETENGTQETDGGEPAASDGGPETENEAPAAGGGQPENGNGTQETQNETGAAGETTVLLLGRSVSYGWAAYMGLEWQEDESYVGEYDGKNIRYHEVSSPPDIVDSSITMLDEYDSDIVFFKLCFVDFGEEQGDRLAEDEQYIQQIYNEVVTKRHRKLIVGNALPQVSMYTTSGMKSNHKAYNQWLSQFASTHSDIQVLDLYGMLSDSSGNLKAGYAVSSDDSHLNDAAYAKITPAFMDAIGNAD